MFDQIKRICRNVKKLDSDKLLKVTFNQPEVKEQVSQLQKSQMYDDGVDSKGATLGLYSDASVNVFQKPAGHIRVYDTGEFYDSIKIKSDNQQIVINANTLKVSWDGTIDLLDRWKYLLGLNEKSLSEIREFILPLVREQVRAEIFR
jgi:hypothetical protein